MEMFTKSDINLVDHLLSFQTSDGGFQHTAGESRSNAMATEQALQALVAFDLFIKDKGVLYDFNDIPVLPAPKPDPEPTPEPDPKPDPKPEALVIEEIDEVEEIASHRRGDPPRLLT